jgi:hypothetical protein
MAAPEGLEPPTLGSEDQCSIQLSYGAAFRFYKLRAQARKDQFNVGEIVGTECAGALLAVVSIRL